MEADIDTGDLESFQTIDEPATASQACGYCKRYKRKCGKQLPKCSLCARLGRECDYGEARPTMPSAEELQDLRRRVSELESLGPTSDKISRIRYDGHRRIAPNTFEWIVNEPIWPSPGQFPTMFFLDSNGFEFDHLQIPAVHIDVPQGPCMDLWYSLDLGTTVQRYFSTVHLYFPIISKIKIQRLLKTPKGSLSADCVLLFLVMALLTDEVFDGDCMVARTQSYRNIKALGFFVESQDGLTLQSIQAQLLTTLYEIGHAIHPAAFLTISQTARLAIAIGLHDRRAPQMLPRVGSWIELEERERTCWGVIILERFVRIGHRRKPLSTPDPTADTPLPVNDRSWDSGERTVASVLGMPDAPYKATHFARTCQSSHLLGQIIRHVDAEHLRSPQNGHQTLFDLLYAARTLDALIATEVKEAEPGYESLSWTGAAVYYSAVLMLYRECVSHQRPQSSTIDDELAIQQECINGLRIVTGEVIRLAQHIATFVARGGVDFLSPLVLDCLYQAAATCTQYISEIPESEYAESLEKLRELLKVVDARWKVAGEYVKILEARETQLASAFVFQ